MRKALLAPEDAGANCKGGGAPRGPRCLGRIHNNQMNSVTYVSLYIVNVYFLVSINTQLFYTKVQYGSL